MHKFGIEYEWFLQLSLPNILLSFCESSCSILFMLESSGGQNVGRQASDITYLKSTHLSSRCVFALLPLSNNNKQIRKKDAIFIKIIDMAKTT